MNPAWAKKAMGCWAVERESMTLAAALSTDSSWGGTGQNKAEPLELISLLNKDGLLPPLKGTFVPRTSHLCASCSWSQPAPAQPVSSPPVQHWPGPGDRVLPAHNRATSSARATRASG